MQKSDLGQRLELAFMRIGLTRHLRVHKRARIFLIFLEVLERLGDIVGQHVCHLLVLVSKELTSLQQSLARTSLSPERYGRDGWEQ